MTATPRAGQVLTQHNPINSPLEATTSALFLAGPQGLDTASLAAILTAAGLKECDQEKEDAAADVRLQVFRNNDALARASEALAEQSGAVLLIAYPAPVPFIARALTAEEMPQEGLTRWLEQVEPLLEVYRRARRRIVLVERAAALANPQSLIAELNERFGLQLKSDRIVTQQTAEPTDSDLDPVHLLIADSACHQDTRARRLAAELEVSSLPLSGTGIRESIDLPLVCRTYRRKSEASLKQVDELQADNARNAELKEENELLLMQLYQVQEELENYFLENRDLQEKLKSTDQEKQRFERSARQATNMLKDAHASLSWKITAPIRLLLRPFVGK
jgi:phosphoglycolate phosphatase-like HAD superfamily hydrolase